MAGFFLGGAAEGAKTAEEQGLKRDTLAADTALRTRGLDLEQQRNANSYDLGQRQLALTQQAQQFSQQRQTIARADSQLSETINFIKESIDNALATDANPEVISKTIQPLVDSAKRIAPGAGVNPDLIDVKVRAMMAGPNATQKATAKAGAGVAAAKKVAQDTGVDLPVALEGQGVVKSSSSVDAALDQPTLEAMAKQYRAGDTSVLTNLGRGRQGAENVVALRKEIARQNAAEGISGEEQAIKNAEYFGTKASQRAVGTRTANIDMAATEFDQVVPIVVAASDAVDRTQYPALNKILQAAQEGTGDPNIVKFGSGINTLINLYARAISPTGTPTVSDKDHAREVLQKAWSQGQFNAAVGMMKQEINAALNTPAKVREKMRAQFLSKGPAESTAAPAPDPLGIR